MTIYRVTFDCDCSEYFFENKSDAVLFLFSNYITGMKSNKVEESNFTNIVSDFNNLILDGEIEDYGYVEMITTNKYVD